MTRSSVASYTSTLVNTHMVPTERQQMTGKRKPEDSNPLLNAAAAKRAKKEASKSGASSKRKLNHEEGPNSLLIVRAQDAHTHTEMAPPSSSSSSSSLPHPPSKKFKASSASASSEPQSQSQSQTRQPSRARTLEPSDAEVEKDVRAMDDEADRLRRLSRVHTTVDPTLLTKPPGTATKTANPKPKAAARGKVVDITTPMHERDTPRMERNKLLRSAAMDAIVNGTNSGTDEPETPTQSHRRKSSVSGRGKRISSSFEATGIITQPHNSVSESSFFKHIDADLPEAERIRQLLIWCSLRSSASASSSSSSRASTSTASASSSSSSAAALPPLSASALQALKCVQDDMVRKLAERRIDLSLDTAAGESLLSEERGEMRENEQNVRNKAWEGTYTGHIQQAQMEEDAWKKVSYGYDAFRKKTQADIERRAEDLQGDVSAKARGKRRATGEHQHQILDEDGGLAFLPKEHELPARFGNALGLVRFVLGHSSVDGGVGQHRKAAASASASSRLGMSRAELDAELARLLPGVEYKVDQIFNWTSAARVTTDLAARVLNGRFEVLGRGIAARGGVPLSGDGGASGSGAGSGTSATQLLETYVAPSSTSASSDPMDMLRALSRVDAERPAGQVGDAARRAAREVKRAGEAGFVGSLGGERRLTTVVPGGVPGTPRRGGTPARERTPGRDRTPGR